MNPERWLSPGEVALLFSISTKAVRRAIAARELDCAKLNRRVYRIRATDASIWWLTRTRARPVTTGHNSSATSKEKCWMVAS